MATVAPMTRNGSPPGRFVEALNGLTAGIVTLDFVRRSLGAALEADASAAVALHAAMDDAYHEGRLAPEDYESLCRDLGQHIGEDVPTEWSEQALDEAAPASDTARPGSEPRRAATWQPGAVLRDRFVLQSRLGSTGMSEVFRALDRRRQEAGADNPWLAIKIVGPDTPLFPDALKLLQQEATLAQRLDHPNIVRVFDFDRDGDWAFLTMEWLEGESLAELLTRRRYRPLTVAHAQQVAGEIGHALAFAHARGIVHADVKPGNIFITVDGTAKLLDFGIAHSPGEAATGAAIDPRTPAYASCEVLEGNPATAQDDVYSLACVAYRMFAGRRAYGHHDALTAERAGRRFAPVRMLNATQNAALQRALELRRVARSPDMATFLREFNAPPAPEAAVEAGPVTTGYVAPAAAVSPGRSTPRWLSVAAATTALVIAAVYWQSTATTTTAADPLSGLAPPARALAAGPAGLPPPDESMPGTTGAAVVPTVAIAAAADGADAMLAESKEPEPRASVPPPPDTAPVSDEPAVAMDPAPAPMDVTAPDVADIEARLASVSVPALASIATLEASAPLGAPPVGELAAATADPAPGTGGSAAPTPAASGPRQVRLTELEFRRYVEPSVHPRRGWREPEGWVEVSFIVGTDGIPHDVMVAGSDPPARYDDAALSAVKRWRFEPVVENGVAVERRTAVRLRFR